MNMKIKKLLLKVKQIKYYVKGKNFLNDPHYLDIQRKNNLEYSKSPSRTEVINFLLSLKQNDTCYLEIGVRNPQHNFNHIKANKKYSVDPGVEFKSNPVDFKIITTINHKISVNFTNQGKSFLKFTYAADNPVFFSINIC